MTLALDIRLPIGLYTHPPEIGGILAAERRKSAVNARDLAATFDAVCAQGGARYEHSVEHCTWADIPKVLTDQARLRDLCIFPVITTDQSHLSLVEALIFESGRPVLLLPEGTTRQLSSTLEVAAVAWDHSRSATRAVANALPILQAAKHVYVITVVDEKCLHKPDTGVELCKHLARHGVEVTFDQIQAKSRSIGDALEAHVTERNIDPVGDGRLCPFKAARIHSWRGDQERGGRPLHLDPALTLGPAPDNLRLAQTVFMNLGGTIGGSFA